MKNLLFISLMVLILSQLGFAQNKRPSDFGFVFAYGMGNQDTLDTFNKRFTKLIDYFDGDTTITFILSPAQLDTIYSLMNKIKFFKYPTDFGEFEPSILPSVTYSFRVRSNGIVKKVNWVRGLQSKKQTSVNLRNLADLIVGFIEQSVAYKKLPECRIGWE